MLIAGDIGGTKTDLGVYSIEGGPHAPLAQAQVKSRRTRGILDSAADPNVSSEPCRATVDMLISILASEAGNLALKVLATGGVYMAGGVAVHLLGPLRQPRFMEVFTRKGRFKDLMASMPIHVITIRAALAGAATYGLENLRKSSPGRQPERMSP
jgi:glucokinase